MNFIRSAQGELRELLSRHAPTYHRLRGLSTKRLYIEEQIVPYFPAWYQFHGEEPSDNNATLASNERNWWLVQLELPELVKRIQQRLRDVKKNKKSLDVQPGERRKDSNGGVTNSQGRRKLKPQLDYTTFTPRITRLRLRQQADFLNESRGEGGCDGDPPCQTTDIGGTRRPQHQEGHVHGKQQGQKAQQQTPIAEDGGVDVEGDNDDMEWSSFECNEDSVWREDGDNVSTDSKIVNSASADADSTLPSVLEMVTGTDLFSTLQRILWVSSANRENILHDPAMVRCISYFQCIEATARYQRETLVELYHSTSAAEVLLGEVGRRSKFLEDWNTELLKNDWTKWRSISSAFEQKQQQGTSMMAPLPAPYHNAAVAGKEPLSEGNDVIQPNAMELDNDSPAVASPAWNYPLWLGDDQGNEVYLE